MDWLIQLLDLNAKSSWAANRLPEMFEKLGNVNGDITKLIAVFMAIIECLGCVVFGFPTHALGDEVDLTGYEEVFFDDFNGTELSDAWFVRANGPRRGGYDADEMIEVKNGNLIITGDYRNGEYGEGWYAGQIALNKMYTRGYFEIKCKINDKHGMWSAFWLQAEHPYEPEISKGGIGGCEMDIFESLNDKFMFGNSVSHALHCSGMKGDTSGGLNSCNLGNYYVDKDIYDEYNTYSMIWNEDEYIFYINGKETIRSTWADGVSEAPGQVIVSLELPEDMSEYDPETYTTQYIVDYVRICQLPQDIA